MPPSYTVINLKQGTPEWLRWRHKGIGASDAPIVMGENPWRKPEELLLEKLCPPPTLHGGGNAAMRLGHQLEPEARKQYETQIGKFMQPACVQSSQYTWMRASLDGLSTDRKTIVEIKCGGAVYQKTRKTGRAPSYYYGQLQHIMAVTGNDHIDFWCWWPEERSLPAFENFEGIRISVKRNLEYIDKLIKIERQFWEQVTKHID